MKVNEIQKGRDVGKGVRSGSCNYMWTACARCGLKRWVHYIKKRGEVTASICLHCAQIERGQKHREVNNPRWKGGRRPNGHGYIVIVIQPENPYFSMANSRGEVLEHRLVMTKHLGRCLQPWEIVHHLNGIRTDNRVENLAITDSHNHITCTLNKLLQERIRELEDFAPQPFGKV